MNSEERRGAFHRAPPSDMRLAGTIAEDLDASPLVDHLFTLGIAAKLEPDGDRRQLWIFDEDHLARGKQELAAFLGAPGDPRYRAAEAEARRLRDEKLDRELAARRNVIEMPRSARLDSRARRPLTMILLAAMAVVFVTTDMGDDPVAVRRLQITQTFPVDHGGYAYYSTLPEIRNGEGWRLFSTMLLHFGIGHFVLGALGLMSFGRPVEALRGTWRFALLVLLLQAVSALAQFYWSGPNFGGMSGVLFGLFGYIWMKARFEPFSGFIMPGQTVVLMLLCQVLCISGALGNSANACHIAGQLTGIAVGIAPTLGRRLVGSR